MRMFLFDIYFLLGFVPLIAAFPSWPLALAFLGVCGVTVGRMVVLAKQDLRIDALEQKLQQLQNVVGLKSLGQR